MDKLHLGQFSKPPENSTRELNSSKYWPCPSRKCRSNKVMQMFKFPPLWAIATLPHRNILFSLASLHPNTNDHVWFFLLFFLRWHYKLMIPYRDHFHVLVNKGIERKPAPYKKINENYHNVSENTWMSRGRLEWGWDVKFFLPRFCSFHYKYGVS